MRSTGGTVRHPLHKLRQVRSPWIVLAVLATAQFIDTLDVTIVNVALPHISHDLHFGAASIQWVISAYTLLYGGFLLLGGRLADLFGRRRMFLIGLVLFGSASLAAGLAPDAAALVGIRAVQGLGGALIAPAALSLLTVTFPSGRDRNIALGVWGSLAGLGGTFGVIIGGLLIDSLSWRAIFLVNVPIVIALLVLGPLLLSESRASRDTGHNRPDVLGALLATGGLLALVLAVVRAEPLGFGSLEVLALAAISVVLLSAFVVVERRSDAPLVPLSLFRNRSLTVNSAMLTVNAGAFLAMFFLTGVYLQGRLHLSALHAGLDFLPMGIAAILAAIFVSQIVTRVGTRPVQLVGAALAATGLVLLARSRPEGAYAVQLLPGLVLFGAGVISVGVPTQVAAVSQVGLDDAGIASGVVNTAWQVGGSLGLAIASTVSASHVTHRIQAGAGRASALVSGYHYGLAVAAGLAVLTALLVFLAPQLRPTAEQIAAATA
jgi:EmrB/QacA subfamily drug resistance transporter